MVGCHDYGGKVLSKEKEEDELGVITEGGGLLKVEGEIKVLAWKRKSLTSVKK